MRGVFDKRQQKKAIAVCVLSVIIAAFFVWCGIETKMYILGTVAAALFIIGAVILALNFHFKYFSVNADTVTMTGTFFKRKEIPINNIVMVKHGFNRTQLGNISVLTITEKSGKKHSIEGLNNASAICSYMLKYIPKNKSPRTKATVTAELKTSVTKRICALLAVAFGIALMITGLYLIVSLLNGKPVVDESVPATVFIISAVEIAAIIVIFTFLYISSRYSESARTLRKELGCICIFNSALPKGNVIKVFTDREYTVRYTVFEDELTKRHSSIDETVKKNGELVSSNEIIPFENEREYRTFINEESLIDITPEFAL